MFRRGEAHDGFKLTGQELVQRLCVHVPAFRFLDAIDNLKGLVRFGSDHHPWERQRGGGVSALPQAATSPRTVRSRAAPGVVSRSCRVGL